MVRSCGQPFVIFLSVKLGRCLHLAGAVRTGVGGKGSLVVLAMGAPCQPGIPRPYFKIVASPQGCPCRSSGDPHRLRARDTTFPLEIPGDIRRPWNGRGRHWDLAGATLGPGGCLSSPSLHVVFSLIRASCPLMISPHGRFSEQFGSHRILLIVVTLCKLCSWEVYSSSPRANHKK